MEANGNSEMATMVIAERYCIADADGNDLQLTTSNLEGFIQQRIRVQGMTPCKYAINVPMYKVDGGGMYEIFLISDENKLYLSDEGSTYEELDRIFELTEPDVIKNLVAILRRYGCKKIGKNMIMECTPNDIHIKISYFIQALSFMLDMKIFYV